MNADSCRFLINEALQKIAEYRAELAKIPLHVEALNGRIASRSDRIDALIDEIEALSYELHYGYPKPVEPAEPEPVEPAELDAAATAEAEEIARRVAELKEQTDRELHRREAEYQSEQVEVAITFIERSDGVVVHHSGRRRMQRRYVAQHEAEMAALAARLGQRPVQRRPTHPWVALQAPPHSLGLQAPSDHGLAGHDKLQYVLRAARAQRQNRGRAVERLDMSAQWNDAPMQQYPTELPGYPLGEPGHPIPFCDVEYTRRKTRQALNRVHPGFPNRPHMPAALTRGKAKVMSQLPAINSHIASQIGYRGPTLTHRPE